MASDSPYDDLGGLAPQPDPSWSEEANATPPQTDVADAFTQAEAAQQPGQAETLPQPRDTTPGPVPLDQYVRNQYGEAIRKKTGDPIQDMAIVNAKGENIARPTVDASGQAGQETRPPPQLHPGTLKAIYERANAAVPPIPPGNWNQQQLYSLTLHRNDKVEALAQRMQDHQQRLDRSYQDRALLSAENQRREQAKHQAEMEVIKAKAESASSKDLTTKDVAAEWDRHEQGIHRMAKETLAEADKAAAAVKAAKTPEDKEAAQALAEAHAGRVEDWMKTDTGRHNRAYTTFPTKLALIRQAAGIGQPATQPGETTPVGKTPQEKQAELEKKLRKMAGLD